MRHVAFLSLILMLLAAGALAEERSADEVARRAIDILAGPAWEKGRYIAFTFNVDRDGKLAASYPQRWDRRTGDYRVSGKNRQGVPVEVIMNVNSRKGRALENGIPVTDPQKLADDLTFGYQRFKHDTFWLLMPLTMFDPGVRRTYEGERSDSCGHTWDLVKLAGAGDTPGDVYWVWVNRDTGMVDEWDMKVQGTKPEDRPVEVMFHDVRRVAGILLSTRREIRGAGQMVRFDELQILPDVPKRAFD
jgi:hypothetical protein